MKTTFIFCFGLLNVLSYGQDFIPTDYDSNLSAILHEPYTVVRTGNFFTDSGFTHSGELLVEEVSQFILQHDSLVLEITASPSGFCKHKSLGFQREKMIIKALELHAIENERIFAKGDGACNNITHERLEYWATHQPPKDWIILRLLRVIKSD